MKKKATDMFKSSAALPFLEFGVFRALSHGA